MKNHLIAATLGLAFVLPFAATAQGRHDEKPHGMTRPAATAPEQPRVAATGGRHDSGLTTHGVKKRAAPKNPPLTDAAEQGKQSQ